MTPRSSPASPIRRLGRVLCLVALAGAPAVGAAAWGYDPKPGKIADGKLVPGRPPSATFGDNPALTCPDTSLARSIKDQLDELARASKRKAPQPDGRLCAVAEAFLAWEDKEEPGEDLRVFVGRYFGIPHPVRRVAVVTFPTDDPKILAEQLLEPLGNFGLNAAQPRYGFATRRIGGARGRSESSGVTRVVLALQDSPFSLEPVPRRLALGEKARLAGKLLGDYANPRLAISDVMGRASTPRVPPGTAFEAEVACGDRPGRIQVQLGGELGGSAMLVARFPIACGTELATSVPLVDPSPWPTDPAKQERRMLDEINAERTAVGLRALAWDDALAGVARDICATLRDEVRRGSADVPSDVVQRLKKAGVASPLVLQNPAQARTAEAASDQLLSSPGHRENIMSPEVTNAGIGVLPDTGPDGKPTAFVTQIFVKELPPLDPEAVRAQLRAAVERKRKDARQPAVTFDKALEEVAERYARELAAASGTLPEARKKELTAPLGKAFRTINVLAGAKSDPLDFAEEPEVVSAGKFAGVGVAIGTHPILGRNAVFAVVLVATKR